MEEAWKNGCLDCRVSPPPSQLFKKLSASLEKMPIGPITEKESVDAEIRTEVFGQLYFLPPLGLLHFVFS